ncbi:hypothetical protein GDO81_008093 [Engystomops pustulosus]|uniref:Sulfotransferase n=1 Tax=Engystomops pustulosus TaxID=76066 RepID=A0AAV7CDN5_ENGPU|nr:hypothetical protein GDO81_008093 [Engystomops pustulosus]
MEIRDRDLFLVTYPRSGTIWTQQILSLIFNEGYRNGTENIYSIERAPSIEYNIDNYDFNSRPSPRFFSSHLPYYLMPRDLKFRMGKVIYVYRNPKDVLVSYYHFCKMNPRIKYTITWETLLDLFMSERASIGSWFDHVRGWYTHKEDYSILLMTYEEMKKDLHSSVLKISKFVDINLDDKAIDTIVKKATFNNMKQNLLAIDKFVSNYIFDQTKGEFLRKGIVGDWKNMMTVSQSAIFNKLYKEKMGDLPIKIVWDLKEEIAT